MKTRDRSPSSALEEAIGGRGALTELLSANPRDTKQDILLRLLADPARAGDSLAKLCADAGVSSNEVLAMFRDAAVQRGLVAAQATLAERLDKIAGDVADKARDNVFPCSCVVLSAAAAPDPACENCGGRGQIFRPGSLKHAELVFKAAGLTQEGGGVRVNVSQQVGISGSGSFLDRFVTSTDSAAFDVVDAVDEGSEATRAGEEIEPEAG